MNVKIFSELNFWGYFFFDLSYFVGPLIRLDFEESFHVIKETNHNYYGGFLELFFLDRN